MNFDHTSATPGACPYCGFPIEFSSGSAPPEHGDWSVCIDCASVGRFRADLSLRKLTRTDRRELAADPEATRNLARVVAAIKLAGRHFGRQQRCRAD